MLRGRAQWRSGWASARLALVAVAVLVGLAVPPATAAVQAGSTGPWSVPVVPRRMVANPGYVYVNGRPVLRPQQLVSIGRLSVPAPTVSLATVLDVSVDVTVPQRTAMALRAWCHPATPRPQPAPDRSQPDVLVIGQNPYPGSSGAAVASRTLRGRLPVRLEARVAVSCELQASPRTEHAAASWLRVDGGILRLQPRPVLAANSLRSPVLVPRRGAVGVAGILVKEAPTRLTVVGDVSLTNCYAGYRLCSVQGSRDAVVDARVVLLRRRADGTVCRRVTGPTRRVVVTVLAHHVRVPLTAVTDAGPRCGPWASGRVEVRHVSGNTVEVDALPAPSSMTLVWLQGIPDR